MLGISRSRKSQRTGVAANSLRLNAMRLSVASCIMLPVSMAQSQQAVSQPSVSSLSHSQHLSLRADFGTHRPWAKIAQPSKGVHEIQKRKTAEARLVSQPTMAKTLSLSSFMSNKASQKLVLPLEEAKRFDKAFKAFYVADLANRRMFVRSNDGLTVYRMGIGRPAASIPYGRTRVTLKRSRPTWVPTPEARVRNPFLPKSVRASEDNPLGARALNTTWQYYLIHGTNDHEKIGRAATWGCMSLAQDDVIEVFAKTRKGAEIIVHKEIDFEIAGSNRVGPAQVAVVRPRPKPKTVAQLRKTVTKVPTFKSEATDEQVAKRLRKTKRMYRARASN